jgi:class 3 adenylate cyclase
MDVGAWLRSLGFERYAETFRSNEIDEDILPELSEADLEKLGIPLGPRKRLLKAIAELGSAVVQPDLVEERRQITILFCDMVGSTSMSARLDPEDLRALMTDYHRLCTECVTRNGGRVAQYLGPPPNAAK